MTKKDFIALADSIREHNNRDPIKNVFNTAAVNALADFCQSRNPAFKRSIWIDYINGQCGPGGGKVK